MTRVLHFKKIVSYTEAKKKKHGLELPANLIKNYNLLTVTNPDMNKKLAEMHQVEIKYGIFIYFINNVVTLLCINKT